MIGPPSLVFGGPIFFRTLFRVVAGFPGLACVEVNVRVVVAKVGCRGAWVGVCRWRHVTGAGKQPWLGDVGSASCTPAASPRPELGDVAPAWDDGGYE